MTNDVNDELSALAIRQALEQHGHYFETVNRDEGDRVEKLGRLGRAIAEDLGVEVSMAAQLRRDGAVQICITVVKASLTPEPA